MALARGRADCFHVQAPWVGGSRPWTFPRLPGPALLTGLYFRRYTRQSCPSASRRPAPLCTGLWTACADTPPNLWATWGTALWTCLIRRSDTVTTCNDAMRLLCAEKSFYRRTVHNGRKLSTF